MEIFLSYSSAQRTLAESLALSLRGQGFTVFFDRSEIEAGDEYDARIRNAIEACDLFIFLISPESLSPGSYPMAELAIAQKRWTHPGGRVLPILVGRVPKKEVPPYLRAVSILEPQGDFVAEASDAVARMARKGASKFRPALLVALAILVLLGAGFGYRWLSDRQAVAREVSGALNAAQLQVDGSQYKAAFIALGAAAERFPGNDEIRKARERAAELWVRNASAREGESTLEDISDAVAPVLTAGATLAQGMEAGDLLAHIGWSEYLRSRNARQTDPAIYYRKALEADPSNPFAHAMWGFWMIYRHESTADAMKQFDAALSSGRERQWAANLRLSALLFYTDESLEAEAIRAVNAMRSANLTVENPNRIWNIYQSNLLYNRNADAFLRALPAGDQTSTFNWLFPDGAVREDRLQLRQLVQARLQEYDGNSGSALATYRDLATSLKAEKAYGSLLDRAEEGVQRLSSPTRR